MSDAAQPTPCKRFAKRRIRAFVARCAPILLLGLLALALAEPIRAFQDGGSITQTPLPRTLVDPVRYKWVMAGMGRIEGRTSSLGSYEGPNGEQISTVTADFGVIAAAKIAHEHVDHSAAEIVKQADILDESGKVIGYRSVLNLVDKDGKKSAAIVITKGGNFREYISSSLRDVVAFENYMKSLEPEHPKQ